MAGIRLLPCGPISLSQRASDCAPAQSDFAVAICAEHADEYILLRFRVSSDGEREEILEVTLRERTRGCLAQSTTCRQWSGRASHARRMCSLLEQLPRCVNGL